MPAKRIPPPVEGESPTLMKRRRHCSSSSILGKEDRRKEPETRGHFVNPIPNFDKKFEVKYADREQVIPQPFSFEERERNKAILKPASEEVSGCYHKSITNLVPVCSIQGLDV